MHSVGIKPALIVLFIAILLTAACGGGSVMETVSGGAQPGWIMDTQSQCAVWNPMPKPDETVSWSGPCVDGKAHGLGTLVFYENGQAVHRYIGELKNGYLDGRVVYTSTGGYRFEGLYAKDQKVKGTETYAGNKYEGEFKDDEYNGYGVLTHSDGTVEKGIWKDGKLVEPR